MSKCYLHKILDRPAHLREKPPVLDRKTSFDPSIPIERACPVLLKKLQDAKCRLSEEESIDLLSTCITYGAHNAQQLKGKDAIIVIGNTGAGKSSFVNYLAGCRMVFKSPEELGLKGCEPLRIVKPKQEGGDLDEIMPIGHTKKSKTFMPHIATTAQRTTYCDCPGFLDNRGAEINIANAVNIRCALSQAKGIKVIILINYHSTRADRSRGLKEMIDICSHLFGSTQNIEKYKDSILVGVTQMRPRPDFNSKKFKEWLIEDTPKIMKALSERIFFFDPLDRPLGGAWKREECLGEIKKLKPILCPSKIFQTVLTDSDEQALLKIADGLSASIQRLLKAENTKEASKVYSHLVRLRPIDHPSVERLLGRVTQEIIYHHVQQRSDFKGHCLFHRFRDGKGLLERLKLGKKYFPQVLRYRIEHLERFYQDSYARYQEQQKREEAQEKALKAAEGRIEELLKLLDEQKKATKEKMAAQAAKFEELLADLRRDFDNELARYDKEKEDLRKEFESRMKQKEKELKLELAS